jgi:hypothetical protein
MPSKAVKIAVAFGVCASVAYLLSLPLLGWDLVTKVGSSRHYQPLPQGLKTVAAPVVLREKVIQPLLAGIAAQRLGRKPKNWSSIGQHYETLRLNM